VTNLLGVPAVPVSQGPLPFIFASVLRDHLSSHNSRASARVELLPRKQISRGFMRKSARTTYPGIYYPWM
jgi:hypothetical protein